MALLDPHQMLMVPAALLIISFSLATLISILLTKIPISLLNDHDHFFTTVDRKDLFIFASFYYKNNESHFSANENQSVGVAEENANVAILFLAHSAGTVNINMRCANETRIMKRVAMIPGQLRRLNYNKKCQLALFVTLCQIKKRNFDAALNGNRQYSKNINLWLEIYPKIYGNQEPMKIKNDKRPNMFMHKIRLKPANIMPRRLLIYINTLVAFEQWPLLIVAMEAYKAFGVDLIVIPIHSAVVPVFKLLRAYEQDGWVTLRKTFRLNFMSGMEFDPEHELEQMQGQAMAHQCFYEFRASTQFIAILDLEDLLISQQSPTLTETLLSGTMVNPNASYFYFEKFEAASIDVPTLSDKKIRANRIYNNKHRNMVVVRPDRLLGIEMDAKEDNSVKLPPRELLILHLTNENINWSYGNQYIENWMRFISNKWPITANFSIEERMLRNEKFAKILPTLPSKMYNFLSIQNCFNYYNMMAQNHCPSYSYCLDQLKNRTQMHLTDCIIAKSEYITYKQIGNDYIVHINEWTDFYLSNDGCFDEERGKSWPSFQQEQ